MHPRGAPDAPQHRFSARLPLPGSQHLPALGRTPGPAQQQLLLLPGNTRRRAPAPVASSPHTPTHPHAPSALLASACLLLRACDFYFSACLSTPNVRSLRKDRESLFASPQSLAGLLPWPRPQKADLRGLCSPGAPPPALPLSPGPGGGRRGRCGLCRPWTPTSLRPGTSSSRPQFYKRPFVKRSSVPSPKCATCYLTVVLTGTEATANSLTGASPACHTPGT